MANFCSVTMCFYGEKSFLRRTPRLNNGSDVGECAF